MHCTPMIRVQAAPIPIGFDDVLIAIDGSDDYKNEDIQLDMAKKTSLGEVMYV